MLSLQTLTILLLYSERANSASKKYFLQINSATHPNGDIGAPLTVTPCIVHVWTPRAHTLLVRDSAVSTKRKFNCNLTTVVFLAACDCHLAGTQYGNTSSCNVTTGQCKCNQTLNTGGRRCNVCQENAWNRTDSSLNCEGKC